mmetsp:Transcript_2490/g.7729  ORF Transcript_2490/g.7729 Transcript_2490/m.7729 type:complete len:626 (-) Transcript_2490:97-1974(-)|eukprot:CAMPEP_0174833704 /NCGR_PEP_ID=MMETSP1114-20130205/4392_1 /TAXON_ID=312471 /ORGANISM="Neobodo designis, Strain CCAP 1951/1" /LENGTH=625 /DNA_ID=CAMNT_0016067595 /DNA_START=79 /DNA_END=1956 /DNA_ORIENTATION=-
MAAAEDDLDQMLADMDAGADVLADGIPPLTEARLRRITGFDDLSCVVEAELTVDAATATVDLLGTALPAVTDLHLAGSRVPSLRAFGTRLVHLKRLWLGRSGVADLSGVQFMHQLSELYLPFNAVEDVSPLSGLLNLEVLDLDSNLVASLDDVALLHGLSELKSLVLSDNPVAVGDGTAEYIAAYRGRVLSALLPETSLDSLDDTPVTAEERAQFGTSADNDEEDGVASPPAPSASFVQQSQPAALDAEKLKAAAELAREKRVLAEGIRATTGVGIDAIVQEEHRSLLSRQSSSAAGTRRAVTGGENARRRGSGAGAHGGNGGDTTPRPHNQRPGLASAPTQVSPKKGDTVVVPRVRQSPPPPAAAGGLTRDGSLGNAEKVLAGNITRSLRKSKAAGSGATLRPMDSVATDASSTSITPPASNTGMGTSASFADAPIDEDIVDETDDAVAKRKAMAEADAMVQRSLMQEERTMTADAERRKRRQAQEQDDADDGDDDDDIQTARKRFLAPQDENAPEIAAWRKRMAEHLAASNNGDGDAAAQASTSSSAPGQTTTNPGDGMSDAEVLYAVKTYKSTTAQALKDDVVREAMGAGPGGADAAEGYEALGLDDLGEGQANNGIYDDVL